MDIRKEIKPHLKKGEKVKKIIESEKFNCCFTNRRFFKIYRKTFRFKKFVESIQYQDIDVVKHVKTLNVTFLLFGTILLVLFLLSILNVIDYDGVLSYVALVFSILTFAITFFRQYDLLIIEGQPTIDLTGYEKEIKLIVNNFKNRGIDIVDEVS